MSTPPLPPNPEDLPNAGNIPGASPHPQQVPGDQWPAPTAPQSPGGQPSQQPYPPQVDSTQHPQAQYPNAAQEHPGAPNPEGLPMVVHTNKGLGVFFMVFGLLFLLLYLLGDRGTYQLILAILWIVLGAFTIRGQVVEIVPGQVRLKNPLGMTLKRFSITSLADLGMNGKKLVHRPSRSAIATLGFQADKNDVEALRAKVGEV